jgi:hydrogenase maturation protein HypF
VASEASSEYPFKLSAGGTFEADMRPTIEAIVREQQSGAATGEISARFHQTVAAVVREACLRIRELDGLNRVCLSGGTFQNLKLLRHTIDQLRTLDFEVFIHRRVPANDGGLALGQALIANALLSL